MLDRTDFRWTWERHGWWMVVLAPLWIPFLLVVSVPRRVWNITMDILA